MSATAAAVGHTESNVRRKRPMARYNRSAPRSNKRHKGVGDPPASGSNEEILAFDVRELLSRIGLADDATQNLPQLQHKAEPTPIASLPSLQSEVEVTVSALSSTGDGLALVKPSPGAGHVYVIPFTVPGDRVTAKVYKHFGDQHYSLTDFVRVNKPSAWRDDTRIRCKYFAKCSGCQFQMLSYNDQLQQKKIVVEKAYQHFSNLDVSQVPEIEETIGSPLEYGYRTKLTPHFDGPPNYRRVRKHDEKPQWQGVPPIGFAAKGSRRVLDIEDCPIGTPVVRSGLQAERKRIADNLQQYRNGATILLRESTDRVSKLQQTGNENGLNGYSSGGVTEEQGTHVYTKSCITDQNATSREYIDDFVFENPAGAFFQNNNSILPTFTQYIRERILPGGPQNGTKLENLIDAYSGSGLFTITLSSLFKRSVGIDISEKSIAYATKNLELNHVPTSQARFMAADAAKLFANIDFSGEQTVVVIDPPRKGCDRNFLRQLVEFSPARVVYVSCNVHTQARDVGMLVGGMNGEEAGHGPGGGSYEIESVRGFDFFPQTAHVEGVAILRKKHQGVVNTEP